MRYNDTPFQLLIKPSGVTSVETAVWQQWQIRGNKRTVAIVNFRFSWKISVTCFLLACAMLCLSRWQWNRHLQKQELVATLNSSLRQPVVPLTTLEAAGGDWGALIFRRVSLSGTFDFDHEIILRNRRYNGWAGVHVLTPLKIDNSEKWVLVDRGFIPLGRENREQRKKYQRPSHFEGYGLVKESVVPKFFSPPDPETGPGKPWADEWLRVHLAAIERQLPYALLPVYLEVMEDPDDPLIPEKIVRESAAGREDMLVYGGQKQVESMGMNSPEGNYPYPAFDTETPPDIHLGYVWEWAFMALLTLGIGYVLQLKRGPNSRSQREEPSQIK
jgi:surfeit locus 1 family protein